MRAAPAHQSRARAARPWGRARPQTRGRTRPAARRPRPPQAPPTAPAARRAHAHASAQAHGVRLPQHTAAQPALMAPERASTSAVRRRHGPCQRPASTHPRGLASAAQLRRRRRDQPGCDSSTAWLHRCSPRWRRSPAGRHLAGRGAQVGARAEPGVAARGARARGAVPVGAGDGGQARALGVHHRRARLAAHHLALRWAIGALKSERCRPGVLPGDGRSRRLVCVVISVNTKVAHPLPADAAQLVVGVLDQRALGLGAAAAAAPDAPAHRRRGLRRGARRLGGPGGRRRGLSHTRRGAALAVGLLAVGQDHVLRGQRRCWAPGRAARTAHVAVPRRPTAVMRLPCWRTVYAVHARTYARRDHKADNLLVRRQPPGIASQGSTAQGAVHGAGAIRSRRARAR